MFTGIWLDENMDTLYSRASCTVSLA